MEQEIIFLVLLLATCFALEKNSLNHRHRNTKIERQNGTKLSLGLAAVSLRCWELRQHNFNGDVVRCVVAPTRSKLSSQIGRRAQRAVGLGQLHSIFVQLVFCVASELASSGSSDGNLYATS